MRASSLLVPAALATLAACGARATPPSVAERSTPSESIIYDPSLRPSDPTITMLVGDARLPSSESKRILDSVFTAGYLRARTGCSEERKDLGGALASGAFVPAVLYRVEGSFTAPRLHQTLYVISNFECDAGPSTSWGTTTLAVLQHDEVVARVTVSGGTLPARVLDLDRDGRNELILVSGYAWMGVMHEEGEVALLDQTGKVTARQLGALWDDDCGTVRGDTPPARRYTVVFAVSSGSGLREERRAAACEEPASREREQPRF